MIKVVSSNGSVLGTQIFDDNDVEISGKLGVEGLIIEFTNVNDVVRANLRIGFLKCEISTSRIDWFIRNPMTDNFQPIRSVRFKNGDLLEFEDDGRYRCSRQPLQNEK